MSEKVEKSFPFKRLKLLGRKVGMTNIFKEDGTFLPVTLIELGPCYVVQIKTEEKDGYNAVQIGYERMKKKRVKKPQLGHFKRAGLPPLRHLREVRLTSPPTDIELGKELTVRLFEGVTSVDVVGRSKGRGFAGTIKRWGFHRGPVSHGSQNIRRPGAIGESQFPARVAKGKRMAGHYGARRVTVKNLDVVDILPEENLLVVKGAVPGPNGGLVEVIGK